METKRRKFQGVLNILSFNRHFYFIGIGLLTIIISSNVIFNLSSLIFWIIISAFVYGLTMPLIISAFVYDYSGFYNFKWLEKLNINSTNNVQIVNINAGFDETSFILKHELPKCNLTVFDFYNPEKHTEAAIVRARKVSLRYPNTKQIKTHKIPLKNKSTDIVFLLLAAHEIRSNREKIAFLEECNRIIKPNGQVVLVEHLRNLPNFLAFSVGFTHFFSRKTWINAFNKAGFNMHREYKFTPFMSVFKFYNNN